MMCSRVKPNRNLQVEKGSRSLLLLSCRDKRKSGNLVSVQCMPFDGTRRCGLKIPECINAALGTGGQRSPCAATEIWFDVCPRWNGVRDGVCFQRPFLFCAVNLPKIVDAGVPTRLRPPGNIIWYRQGSDYKGAG